MEGIDFAGKTGTAQVVSHSAGMTSLGVGKERANAWFVGMAPRRNPDIVVAVLWEHGGWGAGSAPVAAQVINAFVTKQRKRENNIKIAEKVPTPAPQPPGQPTAQAIPAPAAPKSTEASN
jgi:Cell division protein FtsI/penicillin-binding protein 2